MNFLAHLWLADRAAVPLAGAVLGDWLRGALPADMPPALADSVRLHRRIDAATDRHPAVIRARALFPGGARRYAGIVLDLVFDHVLAAEWTRYSREPLRDFARRAGRAVHAEGAWFARAGGPVPMPDAFATLLLSYRTPEGLDRAVHRTARRLRKPDGLLGAMYDTPWDFDELTGELPLLLQDLQRL